MFARSRPLFFCFAVLLFLSAAGLSVRAADAEARAFNLAQKLFDDGSYDQAERSLAQFVAQYPASPRISQALLTEARAALAQRKFDTAIALLTTNMPNAAGIADQFQIAIARSYFTNGNFEAAARGYARLVATHTNSPLRLTATLEEAVARMRLKQWPRVTSLLQNPTSVFQEAAARAPESEAVVDGRLLLAEALLEQRRFAEAEQVANSISDTAITAKLKWRRDHLRAKAQFAAQKLDVALASASNLVALAAASRQSPLEAAAVALEGEILEALNQPEAAIAAYEQNQRADVPPDRMRESLFKIIELTVAQGRLTNALARLENFTAQHPRETGSDVALLTLAELRVKQYQLTVMGTNRLRSSAADPSLLSQAIAECDQISTNSAFYDKARFVRAWALLAEGRPAESLPSFRAAADSLPWSEPQAVARFKTADLEFQSGQLTNALSDYRRVLSEYESMPRVQSELVPRARYQMLLASLAARDVGSAEDVLQKILSEYPVNGYAERSLLIFGQDVDELGDTMKARRAFSRFIALFPSSKLRPEAQLAVARSFERERDWPGAISNYDRWVTIYRTNDDLPSAEFRRAMAYFHAGQDSNAFTLFTNYIARFPTSALAERAQDWVGDFYFRREQFALAERNYQLVYQNRPATPTGWFAKLKAGRAALLRPSFENATNYFVNIANDTNCPTPIVVQALFAYGEAYLDRRTTNALDNFVKALAIYGQVTQFFAGDPLEPRALGQMALCHFQLGALDAANAAPHYAEALELYQRVTNAPAADLATRQQAQVGIGHVLRRQSEVARAAGKPAEAALLLDAALQNYQKVFYYEPDGEAFDPSWLAEAGRNLASIAEFQKNWDSALKVYLRLSEKIPALREALSRKIAIAREQSQKK